MSPPSKVRAPLLAGKALAPINSAKFQIWLATEMLGAQTLGIDSCLQMEGGALDTFFPLAALSCSSHYRLFFSFLAVSFAGQTQARGHGAGTQGMRARRRPPGRRGVRATPMRVAGGRRPATPAAA